MNNFVTFELAKKLKEKGFREKCLRYYDTGDNDHEYFYWNANEASIARPFYHSWNSGCEGYKYIRYDAPTISQVLKWLRETKGLYIEVRFDSRGFGACINKYDIDTLELISFNPLLNAGFSKTYEEAVLVGIEYILDNYN
jgi:hypothetical protein